MPDDRGRICTEHGSKVEAYSAGRWLCPSKTGPTGHKQHIVVEAETHVPGAPPRTLPRPAAPPADGAPARPTKAAKEGTRNKTFLRWKATDDKKRILWLHAILCQRRAGETYFLRWQIVDAAKKASQGYWGQPTTEQAARAEFQAQIARCKESGWVETQAGGFGSRTLVLKPVPGAERKGKAA